MLITFEGIDASGKSTQLDLLAERLIKQGFNIVTTREPGGTVVGQLIREILLNPQNTDLIPEAEVMLYLADRLQHIKQFIEPALTAGKIVLCDRYHDATIAYQGYGRQIDLDWLLAIQKKFIRVPDLTLWFDISVETSQVRIQKRNVMEQVESCRLEREDVEFFKRVRDAYAHFGEIEKNRFIRIDAEKEISTIQKQVEDIVITRVKG